MGRRVEEFKPIHDSEVRLYACGPTVYNYAHIGNLRTFLFEDLLVRALTYLGYRVTHVMNITDVGHLTDDGDDGEDKMMKTARERKLSPWEIAEFYTKAFFEDTEKLNIQKPSIVCRATEHIQDMIALVKQLEDRGYTYQAGGNVYFDISKFPRYGELASLDQENLQAGARIEVDQNKRNPRDFVLWFTNSKFEHQAMVWDSPWGQGYPGWHLECSAMSRKYLGDQFDIHCGGVDHVPVHHTNEIAQTEAATGKSPWVRYWLHAEFLLTKAFKMSKSSGNFLTLSRLEEMGYTPMDYRFFCLGAHYRTQLTFTEQALQAAQSARRNLMSRVGTLPDMDTARRQEGVSGLSEKALEYRRQFTQHIADDLNMPRGLADAWAVVKDKELQPWEKRLLIAGMDTIFGLGLGDFTAPEEDQVSQESLDPELVRRIELRIQDRNEARKNRNFSLADSIRDELKSEGIMLIDTPQGTTWTPAEEKL